MNEIEQVTIAQGPDEDRVVVHERQIAYARQRAGEIGGKFAHERGTDAFGHPVIAVFDPEGNRRVQVNQPT
jgi:hypothetical protein